VTRPADPINLDHHNERDYIERTIATVRNHQDADNCWPQWANIFADEIERLWVERQPLVEAVKAAQDFAEVWCEAALTAGIGIGEEAGRLRAALAPFASGQAATPERKQEFFTALLNAGHKARVRDLDEHRVTSRIFHTLVRRYGATNSEITWGQTEFLARNALAAGEPEESPHDDTTPEETPPRCTCTEDESSGGSATYEDDPTCPIHGEFDPPRPYNDTTNPEELDSEHHGPVEWETP
jgi:hypothetical protein